MIFLGPAGYQVGFDLPGLVLLLVSAALLLTAALKAGRFKPMLASVFCFAGIAIGSVQLARGVMAPEQAWVAMLAAIEEARGESRYERIRDLQQHWQHGDIRALAWFRLSHKWGVCHHLWKQRDCRIPAIQEHAVGVAREILDEFVGDPPLQPPSRR